MLFQMRSQLRNSGACLDSGRQKPGRTGVDSSLGRMLVRSLPGPRCVARAHMCRSDRHRGGRNKGGRKIHSPMVTKYVCFSCGILGQKSRGGDRQESQGETREEGK